MNDLSEYDRDMFVNLDTLSVESGWWDIKPIRKDLDRFISAIKKRIDIQNDFEFNGSYTRFRRIAIFITPKNNEITYSIDFREDTGELTEKEKNLPEQKPKTYDKKLFSAALGRAT